MTFSALPPSAYTKVDLRMVCQLAITWQQAQARWSIPFLDDLDQLGRIKVALISTSGGEQIVLVAYLEAPMTTRDRLTLELRHPLDRRAITELDELLVELQVGVNDVDWYVRDLPFDRWAVLRQDDSGNRFVVRECSGRHLAAAYVREFESTPHKQAYWIERVAGAQA